MRNKMWGRGALIVGLSLGFPLTGCTPPEAQNTQQTSQENQGARDLSGATKAEAYSGPPKDRYAKAGARYKELTAFYAGVQRDIHAGTWQDSPTHSDFIPSPGYNSGMKLDGDGRSKDGLADSYTFWTTRFFTPDEPVTKVLERTVEGWRRRGWEVAEPVPGAPRFTTTTPEGYWLEISESGGTVELRAYSPVFWGSYNELLREVAERRDAEYQAKAPGTVFKEDPKTKQASLKPGVYRPFPAWDAVPTR
ncbi:hypothetical protein [Galactobacter caseinivorans]|uniref:Lipoprotein n=1 Tax=Galactobacter caseinivorans TaxID=2676123 RepID=A0A496PHD0_9MICC|nr:hypothetical protein [Galactobacter caseinivorans]RKW69893.1 hypothetical protein DWQ67_10475 [Galactobacter caseinivorans]